MFSQYLKRFGKYLEWVHVLFHLLNKHYSFKTNEEWVDDHA